MDQQSRNSEVVERTNAREPISEVGQLSQWQLTWKRFRNNRLAMTGLVALCLMYVTIALAGFVAPNSHTEHNKKHLLGPPSPITFRGPDGRLGLRPHTYETTSKLDPELIEFVHTVNKDVVLPIRFFVHGDPYQILVVIESDVHLFGLDAPHRFYLLGADKFGRDMFARLLYGGQISMTVGWVGVALTILLGSVLGTLSGYLGGAVDEVMQRMIEVIRSFPTVPLWAALAAALPPVSTSFTALDRYFLITVILSLVNWTGLARQVRAKVIAYRQADFAQAALAAGASDWRIVFVHMLPNAASHIIVVAALAVPGMILGETSLSFLGLGILPPLVSWGALLRDAQQLNVVIKQPWLLAPAVGVILTVLFFSFLGDGLRDAFDPYSI